MDKRTIKAGRKTTRPAKQIFYLDPKVYTEHFEEMISLTYVPKKEDQK